MRFRTQMAAAIFVSAVAASATPAMGAPGDRPAAGDTELTAEVLHALQRDLGIGEQQARKLGAQQAKAIELDKKLRGKLGDAIAGSRFDAATGKLVVLVSEPGKRSEAAAAGADARPAKHSKAKLEGIKADLDRGAGRQDAAPGQRKAGGPRQARMDGITSWFVDEATNTVQVTIDPAKARQARKELARFGDAVSIVESDVAPQPAAFMDGGDLINGSSCSAGFNLRNTSTGKGFLLTAGHCVSAGSTLRGQGSVVFGPVLESWFPSNDDALARNDNPSQWTQGAWVDTNPSNGGVITTTSYTNAPVGTTVCKSGITTKWTCGKIRGKNETVTYTGGKTVYGLTRHDACVEKGDSGGANVSYTSRYSAEGVSSGAQMFVDSSGRYRCLSVRGQQNVSWYYPVATSLAYYGPKYGVSLW
jgi:streptogrisin C